MLVWRNQRLLLIERQKPPFGFAPPAGHVDSHGSYEAAARNELYEEVGLVAERLELVAEGRKNNSCRRQDGNWHYWKIFLVTASGNVTPSDLEVRQIRWCSKQELNSLKRRTKLYLSGRLSDVKWETSPGIESVWYEWLNQLNYF